MIIKKFQGKTENEATEKAKKELGEGCVIMNVKTVKPAGLFAFLKSNTYEVTAAVEEKEKNYDPSLAMKNMQKAKSINIAADEKITIPRSESVPAQTAKKEPVHIEPKVNSAIEMFSRIKEEEKTPKISNTPDGTEINEKIADIRSMIDEAQTQDLEEKNKRKNENFEFIRTLYEVLVENEVDEIYVNQIVDELEKVKWGGNSVDSILSVVYQKMILKFGQPKTIELSNKPTIVFFVGPTGVGKTTTIAKVASKYKVGMGKKVAFLTADTYRIAAAEQLRTYANILDAPMTIVYSPEELMKAIEDVSDYDLVLVDTAGISHKNEDQREDLKRLLSSVDSEYDMQVYLVMSATTKYKDLLDIADTYSKLTDYSLIFTKLDETSCYGNLLNLKLHTRAPLSYTTNGQNVPDDIEIFDTQKIVKQLLGGR